MWGPLVLHDPFHLVRDYYLLKHNSQHDYHLLICTHLHNGRVYGSYNTLHLIYYTCLLILRDHVLRNHVLRAKSYLNLDCDWNQCCFAPRLHDSGHNELCWNSYYHILVLCLMNYCVYYKSYQLRLVLVKPVQLVFQFYCHSSTAHALVGNQIITLLSLLKCHWPLQLRQQHVQIWELKTSKSSPPLPAPNVFHHWSSSNLLRQELYLYRHQQSLWFPTAVIHIGVLGFENAPS